jgi:A/G-specific adenine glycosylase
MEKPKRNELKKRRVFIKTVRNHHKTQGRHDLPWRKTKDPYSILVSEIMLQQTQVERVINKYKAFLKKFPDFKTLAKAPIADLIQEWQGLGYNRRALNLQRTAQLVMSRGGHLSLSDLQNEHFPGIGDYTRGAVLAFAFNTATPVIETNIRAVFIHHFFPTRKKVHDEEILALVEKTLDRKNPREWYYALMDYGAHLKKLHPNPSRKSAHHTKQSKFEGSNRELRSHILKLILKKSQTLESLQKTLRKPLIAIDRNVKAMEKEGFLVRDDLNAYIIKQ